MTDIQAARDTLARWGEGATPGPWEAQVDTPSMSGTRWSVRTQGTPGIRMQVNEYQHGLANVTLIVAMTDPRLRDALDGMLAFTQEMAPARHRLSAAAVEFMEHAEHIAAAILEIDKGLNA